MNYYLTPIQQPPSGGWSPNDLPGISVWFDSTALIGLSNNDPVTSWPSSLVGGPTAVQGSGGSQPLYKTNSQNSLPGVQFDGTNDNMSFSGTDYVQHGTANTVIAVTRLITPGGTYYTTLFGLSTPTANSGQFAFFSNDPSGEDITIGFSGSPSVPGTRCTADFTSTASMVLEYNGGSIDSTSSYSFLENFASQTKNTAFSNGGTGSSNFLGAYPNSSPALTYSGIIYEFIVCGALGPSDLLNLQTYLDTKWAL